MKNKWIGIFVVVVVVAVVVVVIFDALNNRTGKRGNNPYALEVDQYYDVDPESILYKEVRQFNLGDGTPLCLDFANGSLYLGHDLKLKILSEKGEELASINLPDTARCVHADKNNIYIGFTNYLEQYHHQGQLVKTWEPLDERTVITSITTKEDLVFVADAGNRRVLRYDSHGTLLGQFEGKRNVDDLHGFVVPSPNFDLAAYDNELWVVNPGLHALENYSDEGRLRGYWEHTSMKLTGFSGCCNPAHISFGPNGNFFTAEKGLVRVKVYKPSGELIGVVAPPKAFSGEKAPELAVNDGGGVYLLDFDQHMIRFFEKI